MAAALPRHPLRLDQHFWHATGGEPLSRAPLRLRKTLAVRDFRFALRTNTKRYFLGDARNVYIRLGVSLLPLGV